MPSKRYRRQLRAATSDGSSSVQYIVAPPAVIIQEPNCEIDQIRSYFCSAADMITQYMDFADAVETIRGVMDTIKEKVDYYKILEKIEVQLLGVVSNIARNTSVEIIRIRINNIKSYIEQMPTTYQDRGEVSEMIMQVIGIITANIGVNEVSSTIRTMTSYVKSRYKNNECVDTVQDILTSIIGNIGTGVSPGIIALRVDYAKELINKMTIKA